MPRTIWKLAPRDERLEADFAGALGLPPLVAGVLVARGLQTVDQARRFLAASTDELPDPLLLPDMAPVVERIDRALQNGERIFIHGDYDADGVTATALLRRFLTKLGGQVRCFVPHRVRDGYGLCQAAIEQAAAEGATLLIAVDCGVSAARALERARGLGMDALVIDHHEVPDDRPDVLMVDPKRPDAQYPFPDLASVGLAYKVGLALCRHRGLSEASFERAFLDLVAVGTIADVCPLVHENRAFVREGLARLGQTRKVGLSALLRVCDIREAPSVSDIAFRVAPRLNAAGRMDDAGLALELLLTGDPETAHRTSLRLDMLNRERQREQERTLAEARRLVERTVDLDEDLVIVLHSPGWHVGVVGIVAAKLLDLYARPAILLVEEQDTARGSARSMAGFDMAEALAGCAPHLLRHGGHRLAAGLAVECAKIPAFRECLNRIASESMGPEDLHHEIAIDREVELADLSPEVVAGVERLAPFGEGNRPPIFAAYDVLVRDCRPVGREGRHLKLVVQQGQQALGSIGFGLGHEAQVAAPGNKIDLCFSPSYDEYNGRRSLQLKLEAVRPSRGR